tara:strand:+ start:673 stop:861 length:189 start_codon:yes stop_codon:yes gene_type:complete
VENEILCEQAEGFLKSNSSSSYLKISSSRNYTQESSELQKKYQLKEDVKLTGSRAQSHIDKF